MNTLLITFNLQKEFKELQVLGLISPQMEIMIWLEKN